MNADFFDQEMARLAACSPVARDEQDVAKRNALKGEVWRKCSGYSESNFSDVVTWVIEHHKDHKNPPMFSAFLTAADAVRPGNGTPRYDPPPPETEGEKKARHQRWLDEIATFTPREAKTMLPFVRPLKGITFPEEGVAFLESLALQEKDSKPALSAASTVGAATTAPAIEDGEKTLTLAKMRELAKDVTMGPPLDPDPQPSDTSWMDEAPPEVF